MGILNFFEIFFQLYYLILVTLDSFLQNYLGHLFLLKTLSFDLLHLLTLRAFYYHNRVVNFYLSYINHYYYMKNIQSNIKKAKNYLDKSHCVAVPTETVYGLAGNAYSDTAVKKIFNLKRRPANNPLIVHYYNLKKISEDCEINDNFIKLYKKFSPGPITYILKLKKNSKISKFVTNKKKTVAIRFPKHPLFRKLLKNLKYPVAAPSANISSILSITNKPRLLRYGGLSVSKIKKTLNQKIIININSKDKISPGLFPLHYSPGLPLRMNAKKNKK